MFKLLSALLLFFTILHSSEYPVFYSKMGTPLFKSIKQITKLSNIKEIKESSLKYVENANRAIENGFIVDKSDAKEDKKKYLFELRKLQKEYDYILHLLHKEINRSINEKKYALFIELTSYKLDGLLKSRALLDKSIKFYKKNRSSKKSKLLEEKIAFKKGLKAATKEFINVVHRSTFSSKIKPQTPSTKQATSKKPVSISSRQVGKTVIIDIENRNPHSVTINLKPTYTNLKYDKRVSTLVVLKGNTKKEYIKLHVNGTGASYAYSFTWIMGSINAVHDDNYIYRLPYKIGTKHVVSQGYNGEATHKGPSQYAIDFVMDIGTPLCAARGGVVVQTKSDSNKGGYSEKFAKHANHIVIEHNDGTLATYGHLKRKGVGVNIGQRVVRGQVIGYSGNTGYSGGPHLHFSVFKPSDATTTKSMPIKFRTTKGVVKSPKIGVYYSAK